MRDTSLLHIIIILIVVLITGCQKLENEGQDEKLIPVKYYLSNEDKSLLDYFYNHPSITFLNQDNQELIFITDSLYDITMKGENNLQSGEELSMRYTCLTDYFPNYSFVISLFALDTSEVNLDIMFGTGTFWNDQTNDYVLSGFCLDPKHYASIDTTFPNQYILRFDFYDTLTLKTSQFYGVYHMWDDFYNKVNQVTTDCYYTNELGVIAFKNLDDNFWIRNIE